jgi:hypothetical protein
MSMFSDLQHWCLNNWLNLQLIGVDFSIWIKWTPQQDKKSNIVSRRQTTQHHTYRQNHNKRKQRKRLNLYHLLFRLKAKKTQRMWF